MSQATSTNLPDYLEKEILLNPENRVFPKFDLVKLLSTVFTPTKGCKACILVDFDEPRELIKDFAFLRHDGFPVQKKAHQHFYQTLHDGALGELGMTGGDLFAFQCTHGSNLDLKDEVWDTNGTQLLARPGHLSELRHHPLHFHILRHRATHREMQGIRLPRRDIARPQ